MGRREELLDIFKNVDESKKTVVLPLIDDVVFIEEQLEALKKLPFIKVHPTNPELQKHTAAGKQYKELLQQYNNCIKILIGVLNKGGDGEQESPLRSYINMLKKRSQYD